LAGLRREPGDRRHLRAGAALVALALVLVPVRRIHPRGAVLGLTSVELAWAQTRQLGRMLGERESFSREWSRATSSWAEAPGLLRGLGGSDVVMAFIESYGMTALEDPRYAPVVRPSLEAMEAVAAEAGLHLATGLLVAPSQGGQSWLGHGSVLSGLWLENQLRYDLLLASDRGTLVDDFEAAGYRTVAVMPAITM
ncbi:MAG: sulfatase, partial [Gemmatimonadetes bacterium]|nr:sulfatase [Gemmatimonadota bacterium]